MEFTERENDLLIEGIIVLINNAERAYGLVNDDAARESIKLHRRELQMLCNKLCNRQEG